MERNDEANAVESDQKNIVNLMDFIMKQTSTKRFVHEIEQRLPAMFDCERCSVVLVHRWKKYMFRIVEDSDKVDCLDIHEFGKGISSIAAMSGNTQWNYEQGKWYD